MSAYSYSEIYDYIRNENHPILAQLSQQVLQDTIKCTLTIAWLFANDITSFGMIVGEAVFQSYRSLDDTPPHYTGHSFGALIFNPHTRQLGPQSRNSAPWLTHMTPAMLQSGNFPPGLQIVEATGWMDEYAGTDEKAATAKFSRALTRCTQNVDDAPVMRSCTTLAQCDSLYCSIYTLGDHIVFGHDTTNNQWTYGASPSQIIQGHTAMFTVSALINDFHHLSQHASTTNPVVNQIVQNGLPRHHFDRTNMLLVRAAAEDVKNTIETLKTHIHPPPDDPRERLIRLEAWGALQDKHIPTRQMAAPIAFTVNAASTLPWKLPASCHFTKHPFMRSILFMVQWPAK